MFKIISSLLFGGDEDAQQDMKSGEVVDEEDWLLVSHTEAAHEVSSVADQDTEPDDSSVCGPPSDPAVNEESDDANSETDSSATIPSIPSIRSTASQAEALAKMTHVTRVQRAQAWVDRHQLSRSCIQRQNCVCQRAQRPSFHMRSTSYLHQPERRSCTQ